MRAVRPAYGNDLGGQAANAQLLALGALALGAPVLRHAAAAVVLCGGTARDSHERTVVG